MPVPREIVPAVLLALALVPTAGRAEVSADNVVSLTWDGTYQTNLSGVPGAPDFIDWEKAFVPYAKLHFSAATACTDFSRAEMHVWEPQFPGGMTSYVANKTGDEHPDTAVNASISYDRYVDAGAAYQFSGYGYCVGAQPLTWDSEPYYTEVVNVPPVLPRLTIKSPKTGRYFNKLKAGETFSIYVYEYTPRDYSSAMFDPRVFVVVEGAGLPKTEYDITDRTKADLKDIKPTQTGTLTLKVKVQNYLYYRDCWHNVNDAWDDYDWQAAVPNPDYATTLRSTARTCDYDYGGVPCARFGQPVFRAEPYTLESAAVEIPVEDGWCLIQDRADSWNHRVPDEGCHTCSATYNANANWWEDACAPAEPEKPEKPGGGGLSCSAAGPGLALGWLGLGLAAAALRRRRAR